MQDEKRWYPPVSICLDKINDTIVVAISESINRNDSCLRHRSLSAGLNHRLYDCRPVSRVWATKMIRWSSPDTPQQCVFRDTDSREAAESYDSFDTSKQTSFTSESFYYMENEDMKLHRTNLRSIWLCSRWLIVCCKSQVGSNAICTRTFGIPYWIVCCQPRRSV